MNKSDIFILQVSSNSSEESLNLARKHSKHLLDEGFFVLKTEVEDYSKGCDITYYLKYQAKEKNVNTIKNRRK